MASQRITNRTESSAVLYFSLSAIARQMGMSLRTIEGLFKPFFNGTGQMAYVCSLDEEQSKAQDGKVFYPEMDNAVFSLSTGLIQKDLSGNNLSVKLNFMTRWLGNVVSYLDGIEQDQFVFLPRLVDKQGRYYSPYLPDIERESAEYRIIGFDLCYFDISRIEETPVPKPSDSPSDPWKGGYGSPHDPLVQIRYPDLVHRFKILPDGRTVPLTPDDLVTPMTTPDLQYPYYGPSMSTPPQYLRNPNGTVLKLHNPNVLYCSTAGSGNGVVSDTENLQMLLNSAAKLNSSEKLSFHSGEIVINGNVNVSAPAITALGTDSEERFNSTDYERPLGDQGKLGDIDTLAGKVIPTTASIRIKHEDIE